VLLEEGAEALGDEARSVPWNEVSAVHAFAYYAPEILFGFQADNAKARFGKAHGSIKTR
jgi:hypothetical protein